MADEVASLGFSIDSSPLTQAATAANELTASANQAALATEKLATSTAPASVAAKDLAASTVTAGTASEQAAASFAALTGSVTASGAAFTGAAAAAAESTASNIAATASVAALAAAHVGAGAAAAETAVAIRGTAASSREVREAFHLAAFEVEQFGGSMAGLRGASMLARGGVELLAGALGTALVVAMENAADKSEALHSRINAVFGSAGGQTFDAVSASAERLHTSIADIEPAVETAYTALLKLQSAGSLAAGDKLAGMGARFAPGAGGQAAQDALVGLGQNQFKLDPQAKADVENLATVFRAAGVNATAAKQEAEAYFNSIKTNAQQASVTATEDLTKLFKVAGTADAGKATDDFFDKIKQGGLTAKELETLAPQVGNALAQAFGFTGAGAVEKFEAELERVKSISFADVLAGLVAIKPAVDAMEVPESIPHSFEKVKDSALGLLGVLEDHHIVSGFLDFFSAGLDVISGKMDIIAKSKALIDAGAQGQGPINPTVATGLEDAGTVASWLLPPAMFLGRATIAGAQEALGGPYQSFDQLMGRQPSGATDQAAQSGATDQAAQAIDKLVSSEQNVAAPADAAASGLTNTAGAAGQVGTQSGSASSSLSSFGATIAAFIAQIGQAEAGMSAGAVGGATGNSSYGDQTGIQAGAPANIGGNLTGGVYRIGGSGGADSIPLTGMVSPGETVAVIPRGMANASLLAALGQTIGSSPINLGADGRIGDVNDSVTLRGAVSPGETVAVLPPGATTSALLGLLQAAIGSEPVAVDTGSSSLQPIGDIGINAAGGIYTIGTPAANASLANALALAAIPPGLTPAGGTSIGLTSAQARSALAQVAAGVPARTATASGKSAGGGGGGGFKLIDKNPYDPFAAAGFSDDPFAGFSGDPFSAMGGSKRGGRASATSRGAAGSGMVLNPDGSWSPAGMGHAIAPSISGSAAAISRVGGAKGAADAARGIQSKIIHVGDPAGTMADSFKSVPTGAVSVSPDMGPIDPFSALSHPTAPWSSQLDTSQGIGDQFFDPFSNFPAVGAIPSGPGALDSVFTGAGYYTNPVDAGTASGIGTGDFNFLDAQAPAQASFNPGAVPSFDPASFDYSAPSFDPGAVPSSSDSFDYSALDYTLPPSDSGGSGNYNSYDLTGDSGFATGGSFLVRGSGAVDRTPVSFMATAGERVTIETATQQAERNLARFADGGSFTAGAYGFGGALGSPDYGVAPHIAPPGLSGPSLASGGGVNTFGGPAGGSGGWYSMPSAPQVMDGGRITPSISAGGAGDGGGQVVNNFYVQTPNLPSFAGQASRMAMRRTAAAVMG